MTRLKIVAGNPGASSAAAPSSDMDCRPSRSARSRGAAENMSANALASISSARMTSARETESREFMRHYPADGNRRAEILDYDVRGGQLCDSSWQDLHHAKSASYMTRPCRSMSWSSA